MNAHSLGVEVRPGEERVNDKLIPKNTQLPAAASRVYFTARDNQTRSGCASCKGEAHQAEACIPVGECWIDGLPPDLPKGSPVQVRVRGGGERADRGDGHRHDERPGGEAPRSTAPAASPTPTWRGRLNGCAG